ncbi:MAG TPA: universal stress protein [Candidatus Paceibacterota bacterium]|nr:universal stress protein [Verrucomicrobiota bacterium]HSA09796.1 universal stress protein [Candidatus Paceibacterota bacterium]
MNLPSLPESRFKRILFCTDFSESADAAFDFAMDAAVRRPDSTLYLLHVIQEPDAQYWKSQLAEVENINDEAKKAIDAKVAAAYLSRVPKGLEVKVEFRIGPDAATILEFAKSAQIDVIVLGRHGHGSVSKALFGSVAEKIVRKAECAVLVVPLSYAQTPPA